MAGLAGSIGRVGDRVEAVTALGPLTNACFWLALLNANVGC